MHWGNLIKMAYLQRVFGTGPAEKPVVEGKLKGGADGSWSVQVHIRGLGEFTARDLPDEKTARERAELVVSTLVSLTRECAKEKTAGVVL